MLEFSTILFFDNLHCISLLILYILYLFFNYHGWWPQGGNQFDAAFETKLRIKLIKCIIPL